MEINKISLHDEDATYYAEKIAEHGDKALEGNWIGEESQIVKFAKLCKIIDLKRRKLPLNDLGCGYDVLLDYLREKHINYTCLGVGVSQEMIEEAVQPHAAADYARFISAEELEVVAKYDVARGIFNFRHGCSNAVWFDYLRGILDILDRITGLGFAFNCLISYSGKDKKCDYIYDAEPC
jgi:hypothetical protein